MIVLIKEKLGVKSAYGAQEELDTGIEWLSTMIRVIHTYRLPGSK